MVRAGMIELEDSTCETEGRVIAYRKASLTEFGERVDERTPLEFILKASVGDTKSRKAAPSKKRKPPAPEQDTPLSAQAAALEERLRTWRLSESKERGVPAFFIFGDQTLRSIARARPTTPNALLAVPGIGPMKAEKFGEAVCRICSAAN
jgi:ATP-dependent DNA helicase RecQ